MWFSLTLALDPGKIDFYNPINLKSPRNDNPKNINTAKFFSVISSIINLLMNIGFLFFFN